jgi:Ribosomal protein L7/L12 C-terminal domain.
MTGYWIAAIAAVVLLALVSRRGERPASARLRPRDGPPSPERIDQFIRAGQKIEAIKQYRTLHAVDLKAAKDAVEARARELGR